MIAPDALHQETRGKGSNIRHVTDILPEWEPAESLLVVEVITPAGNTSSYPPHKHDSDDLPRRVALEEVYYHRLNPPQGFAFQRVYTDDLSLDETMTVDGRRRDAGAARLSPLRRASTATTSTISTSWPARSASGASITRRSTSGCCSGDGLAPRPLCRLPRCVTPGIHSITPEVLSDFREARR